QSPTHAQNEEKSSPKYDRSKSRVDRLQYRIADQLRSEAGRLRSSVAPWEEDESGSAFKRDAARWLDNAAEYVDSVNLREIESDVKQHVRRNPGRSLLFAGAVGLLLGLVAKRR